MVTWRCNIWYMEISQINYNRSCLVTKKNKTCGLALSNKGFILIHNTFLIVIFSCSYWGQYILINCLFQLLSHVASLAEDKHLGWLEIVFLPLAYCIQCYKISWSITQNRILVNCIFEILSNRFLLALMQSFYKWTNIVCTNDFQHLILIFWM